MEINESGVISAAGVGSAYLSSDVSPEGLYFISADNSASGTAILLTAFEVSGTVVAYAVGDEQITDCTVVLSETTEATCTEDGQIIYTASCTFEDTDYTDEYIVILAAAGHAYVDGVCTVCGAADPDYSTGTEENPSEEELSENPEENSETDSDKTDTDESDTDTDNTASETTEKKTGDADRACWMFLLLTGLGLLAIRKKYQVL